MMKRKSSFPLAAVLFFLCSLLASQPVFGSPAAWPGSVRRNPLPSAVPSRTYAPDRIIVKFRESITEPADLVFGAGNRFAVVAPRQGDELDSLNERFGVTAITPLFTPLPSPGKADRRWQSIAGRRELLAESFTQARQKYGRRSARAPEGLEIPDLSRTYILALPPGADIVSACRAYAANPHVEYAVPSTSYAPQATVNDPYFWSAGSWGNSYDDLWGVKKIKADLVWDTARGAGVVVAVVDTGLDYTHPDITPNVWANPVETGGSASIDDDHNGYIDDVRGWHFDYGVSNSDVTDTDGHGTFVAGIIAAAGDNGSGIVGVAPEAKIMPVKIMESEGFNASEVYANGILYAARNGADVINLSWGCSDCTESAGNPVVADAIAVARGLGAVVVASAGNWSSNAKNAFPAGVPAVLTVSSTDQDDGFTVGSNRGFLVDVAAPGGWDSILSLKTSQTGYRVNQVGSAYLRGGGTSASAAFVSGVAALLLSANPALTIDQVTAIIRQSADDLVGGSKDSQGYDPFFGWGRVNAARAVAMAQSPPTDPPVLRAAGDGLSFNIPQSLCGQERSFSVDIFNVGGGNLTWSLAPLSWLTPVPATGTGNASPVVKIVADQPVSGEITVTSNAADGGTAALPVSVAVMPDMKLTNCAMTLSAAPGNHEWDQPRNKNHPAVPDGSGGAYYTWYGPDSSMFGNYHVYLQHVDSNGTPLWQANGIRVSSTDLFQYSPTVISDGSGGAIVLWVQGLNTGDYADKNLAAQRVSSSGQLLWGSGGIAVTTGGNVAQPIIVSDNSGGALVGWTHLGSDDDLYVQRVSASGALLWQSGGYPLSTAPDEQFSLRGVADGAGGAWFAWIDRRNPYHDVYGQHLDRSGTPLWPVNGRKLNTQSSGSTSPNLVSDGAGGAIIAWYDRRNYPTYNDIYAIHLDGAGQDLWAPAEQSIISGTQVYGLSGVNIPMLEDGQGGAIVFWEDTRNRNTLLRDKKEIYAQRISGAGQQLWPSGGVQILSAEGYDTAPVFIPDGDGGLLAVWQDKRFGSFDIFLQQFSSVGTPRWGSTGLWAHSGTKDQTDPFLVPLGGNRLAITWNDWSNFFNTGIDFRGEIVQLCTDHDGDGYYAEGGVCGAVKATDPVLAVEATGPGRGTVQSLPSGIACGADCRRPFAPGTVVTLKAVAAPHSHFAGWSGGGCSGSGDCTVTLGADTTVQAQFSATRPVKIAENNATIYASPQQAYNNALSGNTIISWAQTFEETLTLNQPVAVELKGGYDADFVSNNDATVIKGALIITNGTATVENIAIQ